MPNRLYRIPNQLTLTLAECANNVYNVRSNPSPPPGYQFFMEWTGKDPDIDGMGGKVENFGAVFQSKTNSKVFIMAFRGTQGGYDDWEDLKFFGSTPFQYYGTPGQNVYVADGFEDIYVTPVSSSGYSMQQQLFNFIKSHDIDELYITGHSLGSSLAELFTLDLYNSINNRSINPIGTIQHINFACPRTGLQDFANYYVALENQVNPSHPTIRVVNYQDFIPCMPSYTLGMSGYYHGPNYYLTYFDWDHLIAPPDPLLRHSIFNYWHVLKFQFGGTPTGSFYGEGGYKVFYKNPGTSYKECASFLLRNIRDYLTKNLSRIFRKTVKLES